MRVNTARNIFIGVLGFAVLVLGRYLQQIGAPQIVSDSFQTAGISIMLLLLGYGIFQLFGGTPELNEIRRAISEFERGAQSDRLGIKAFYKRRIDAKADMLSDIAQSRQSCRMFAAVYIGEILKDPALPEALLRAVRHAAAAGTTYELEYYSFDPGVNATPADVLEAWSIREGDSEPGKLATRISRGSSLFENLMDSIKSFRLGNVQALRKYYTGYLSPHAMLIIDDDIVYVSFYDWGSKQGDFAPALKLRDGPWADVFLKEADVVSRKFSTVAAEYTGKGERRD